MTTQTDTMWVTRSGRQPPAHKANVSEGRDRMTRTSLPRDDAWIMSRVDQTGECWDWTGAHNSDGYGTFRVQTRTYMAHRVLYEMLVGQIPEGLVIDHLCRNPGCVNPAHMEPVTSGENVRRGTRSALRTHCANGHEWIPENLYTRPKNGWRYCWVCEQERRDANRDEANARRRAKRRAS